MNTLTKNLFLFSLLLTTFFLHACGNHELKSQTPPETILKSSSQIQPPPPIILVTPTITVVATSTQTSKTLLTTTQNSYTKKIVTIKHHTLPHVAEQPIMAAMTPLIYPSPTIETTPITFTTTTEMSRKKSTTHWPLIIAGIVLIIALIFYFWTKKAPPHNDFPLPPMGGLSPVGGYTAMRNKIQQETKKSSIWNKKIL